MLVRITSKRQVTFPARVLDALGARPGDQLEIIESPDGFILRPRKINLTRLAPLRDKIPGDHEPFDLEAFRTQPHATSLRD